MAPVPVTFSNTAPAAPSPSVKRYMFMSPPLTLVRKAMPPRAPGDSSEKTASCTTGSNGGVEPSAHAGSDVSSVVGVKAEHSSSRRGMAPTSAPLEKKNR